MNKLLRAALAASLCVGAAACASKPPPPVVEAPPPPPPPPPAPTVSTAFDGVYRGQWVRTAESPKSCHASHHGTIRVAGGTFSTMVTKAQTFQGVQVLSDGSFAATSGDESLKGMIADNKLSGTLDGATCHYTLTMLARAAKTPRS
jgi:hypothetical protein